jgi:hypothetical protein
MNGIDPDACKFALSQIDDGTVFEEFTHSFLAAILGHSFAPSGGIKDRGIDGLDRIFSPTHNEKVLYQYSIEKDPEGKIIRTLQTLKSNKIKYDRFTYVTNQVVSDKDRLIESLADNYKKPIQIFDLGWFAANVNHSPATIAPYEIFIKSYLHEFQKPGGGFVIGDLVSDPRLYVFLRQQWDSEKHRLKLDEVLADTLILFALEDTDPDKGKLKTRNQIIEEITKHLKFEPKLLTPQINQRLGILSSKPNRRIHHHRKPDAYCLPYQTRQELVTKNFKEAALHQSFKDGVARQLKKYLKNEGVRVQECVELINGALNKLFYRQGLEFSDLVSNGYSKEAFEKSLPATIAEVVDESGVVTKNKQSVKQALLLTIRHIVYNGTVEEKEYLRCLANTYMLLFLLQCDPKVSMFFTTMAARLDVYVCTSIIIPALSEVCLDPPNKRYWNLLTGARSSGVRLRINQTILSELAAHFRKIKAIFDAEYAGNEALYDEEVAILYIDEIMIRAYFYSKLRGQVRSFDEFVDKFCSPDLRDPEKDLLFFVHETFGIEFVPEDKFTKNIDAHELSKLATALEERKRDKRKASNDAKLILSIFAIREGNNESNPEAWAGYRTWWLSSDTLTQRTVNEIFVDKYKISCYMRPDFLYNYISLAPATGVISEVYKSVFPNLLGVNISHNIPSEITGVVHNFIKEHQDKQVPRLKAILCNLSDRLKSDPTYMSRNKVQLFLEQERQSLASGG